MKNNPNKCLNIARLIPTAPESESVIALPCTAGTYEDGETVFVAHTTDGWEVSSTPYRTNMSREVRLFGFCGSTDNRSVTAMGAGRIRIVQLRGGRSAYQVVATTRAEARDILEQWEERDEAERAAMRCFLGEAA